MFFESSTLENDWQWLFGSAKQNNYLSKILNVYIAYDLDASPRNPTNNFKLKSCLFGATNIVKNNYKEKVFEGIRNNI